MADDTISCLYHIPLCYFQYVGPCPLAPFTDLHTMLRYKIQKDTSQRSRSATCFRERTGSRTAFVDQFPDRQPSERDPFAQLADASARGLRTFLIESWPFRA